MPALANDQAGRPRHDKGLLCFGTSRSSTRLLLSRFAAGVAMLALAAFLGGCATTQADGKPREKNPILFEKLNWGVYKFDETLDRYALKPVATAWIGITTAELCAGWRRKFREPGYLTSDRRTSSCRAVQAGGQETARHSVGNAGAAALDVEFWRQPPAEQEPGTQARRWPVAAPRNDSTTLPSSLSDGARCCGGCDHLTQPFDGDNSVSSVGYRWAEARPKRVQSCCLTKTCKETYAPVRVHTYADLQRGAAASIRNRRRPSSVRGRRELAEESAEESESRLTNSATETSRTGTARESRSESCDGHRRTRFRRGLRARGSRGGALRRVRQAFELGAMARTARDRAGRPGSESPCAPSALASDRPARRVQRRRGDGCRLIVQVTT